MAPRRGEAAVRRAQPGRLQRRHERLREGRALGAGAGAARGGGRPRHLAERDHLRRDRQRLRPGSAVGARPPPPGRGRG